MGSGPSAPRAPALWSSGELAVSSSAPTNVETTLCLRTLFEQHYGSVARLLRRFGVPATQLDDAAQEVFWVASRRLLDILPGKETTFLYGVALRVALNEARRKRSVPAQCDIVELSDVADQAPSPEEQLDLRQSRDLLDAVLESLPMELRTVFVLFELEGLPVPEIAELEAIPVGTASSRLRRARQEFAGAIKRMHAALAARRSR
jgi:RNA polymerase sigma-70 factor, ECF subfamily